MHIMLYRYIILHIILVCLCDEGAFASVYSNWTNYIYIYSFRSSDSAFVFRSEQFSRVYYIIHYRDSSHSILYTYEYLNGRKLSAWRSG